MNSNKPLLPTRPSANPEEAPHVSTNVASGEQRAPLPLPRCNRSHAGLIWPHLSSRGRLWLTAARLASTCSGGSWERSSGNADHYITVQMRRYDRPSIWVRACDAQAKRLGSLVHRNHGARHCASPTSTTAPVTVRFPRAGWPRGAVQCNRRSAQ
jgi:hypothetical protein